MKIEQLKHVGTKQERSCEFKVVPLSVCLLSITTQAGWKSSTVSNQAIAYYR